VIFPFVFGGAFAFLLNIPMSFFEKKLFERQKKKEKKWAIKLARPVSLIATLVVVFGIVAIVMLVVIPELGRTVLALGKTVQEFVPEAKEWGITVFHEYETITEKIAQINFKWDAVLEKALDFLKNGAGNVIDSTYAAAKSIVSGIATFFIALVFS
jgi:predicted PurR-regulated permease PerM